MVVFPLKCTCIPYLLHICLMLSAVPFVYGMTICPYCGLVCLSVIGCTVGMVVDICITIVVPTCVVVVDGIAVTCILLVVV